MGFQRHADKVLQSQILPDSILDFAKDSVIDIDVSSSDYTDIQWSFLKKKCILVVLFKEGCLCSIANLIYFFSISQITDISSDFLC